MQDASRTCHVISHTHWDPEWYLTFQQYRIRLVQLMDKLLDILRRNPEYGPFMLDGQSHVVESYLEVRPEKEKELTAHVQSGRLLVGPWYVMPELFMLSGECHIRNLMHGMKLAQKYGGAMKLGYLCDSPGFISQLPQILRGFDIDIACGWRGIGGYPDTDKTPFWLESPDGSKVLMLYLPWAYGTAWDIGLTPSRALDVLKELERQELPFSATGDIVAMDGADHREPVEGTVDAIRELNRVQKDVRVVQSSLERFAAEVLSKNPKLKTHRGELRGSASSFIFASGILATRMNVKQANFRCQAELEKWAEPFCAAHAMLGADYPLKLLEHSWRLLLTNAFHDVIYGGHVDGVTEDALNRGKQSFEIADWLGKGAMSAIAYAAGPDKPARGLVLFNAAGQDYEGIVNLDLHLDLVAEARNLRQFVNENQQPQHTVHHIAPALERFVIVDEAGRELPFQINARKRVLDNQDDSQRDVYSSGRTAKERISVSLALDQIPSLGYKRFRILPISESAALKEACGRLAEEMNTASLSEGSDSADAQDKSPWRLPELSKYVSVRTESDLVLASAGNACENALLKVAVNSDGTLDVYDKSADAWYRGLHVFEDCGDVGDHYFFYPPTSDVLITSRERPAQISVVKNGPLEIEFKIEHRLELPEGAAADRRGRSERTVPVDVETCASVKSRSRRIDFRTRVVNRAKDHRLRVLFPTDIAGRKCHADSIFDVVERERLPEFRSHWREKPLGHFPQSLFTDLSDGKRGVAFFNKGLPQYQAAPDGTYCLTLFRAVSHLGKYYLPQYGGEGSPETDACFPTPSAQMIGEHTYEYAAFFHEGNWRAGRVHVEARRFCFPPRFMQTFAGHYGADPTLPAEASFVRIEPDACVLSCLKRSEDGLSFILRFFNISDELLQATVKLWSKLARIERATLAEMPDGELGADARTVSLPVRAHEIVTLRLTC